MAGALAEQRRRKGGMTMAEAITDKTGMLHPDIRRALRKAALAGDENALDALLMDARMQETIASHARFDEAVRRAFDMGPKS
jgi:hypothetical protein